MARWMVATGVAVVVFAIVAALPWEWSFIDDGALLSLVRRRGFTGSITDLYHLDVSWGLFRPAFWLYAATFYQLPVGVAHAARVFMLAVVFAGAVAAVVDGARRWLLGTLAALAVAANAALFMGLWYPSLQELSGLCFVGLGLFARKHPWLAALCWLTAAWFKPPFAWLFFAYGLLLLRRREHRAVGALAAALGLGTLVAAAVFARRGYYTDEGTNLALGNLRDQAQTALARVGPALLVLVAIVIAFRPRPRPLLEPVTGALLLGGALYAANLLAWRTDQHYSGPYVYLLTVGALLVLRDLETVPWHRVASGLVVPALVAGLVGGGSLLDGRTTMRNVAGLRDCVLSLPDGAIVGYNRLEASARLDFIVREHRPTWRGRVVAVKDGETVGTVFAERIAHLDYYIYQEGTPGTPSLRQGSPVCATDLSTLYRVT